MDATRKNILIASSRTFSSLSTMTGKKEDQESKQDQKSTKDNEKDHFKVFDFKTWFYMVGYCSLPYAMFLVYYYFKRLSLTRNENLKLLLNESMPNEQDKLLNVLKEILSLVKAHHEVSECALEILSRIFHKRSSPKLSEEFFTLSTQPNSEFNTIELALNILRENYSQFNFKDAWILTNSLPPSNNKYRLNKKEKMALEMIKNVFSNSNLLEHILKEDENNQYANHLALLFKSENALDKCIATLCVNQMVRTLDNVSDSTTLSVSQLLHSNLVKSMIQSSTNTSMPDYDFRDQVRILEDRMNMVSSGKTGSPLPSTRTWLNPNYSNNQHMFVKALILSSAFVFFIHAKRPQSLKLLNLSKTMIRSTMLFTYTVLIGNYRPTHQLQSETTHQNNKSLPLREYIRNWNHDQFTYYYSDFMLFCFMYGFVRNWFAFLPFPLLY
ncbi:hypothetical protein C9374_003910 [Naegleria lovaniensis]|uniref:Uncharacterized protein n=1 Tax=Naegleria lovaniensis TaxID=51637 RepID=A0AA88KSI1_NAELO|nr:uncharacterized protein C9374_003910 [Naegleria lovaniensis]KAG2394146.1 hypothetical protein C9374_003910 [Naegleria lovaniensis]